MPTTVSIRKQTRFGLWHYVSLFGKIPITGENELSLLPNGCHGDGTWPGLVVWLVSNYMPCFAVQGTGYAFLTIYVDNSADKMMQFPWRRRQKCYRLVFYPFLFHYMTTFCQFRTCEFLCCYLPVSNMIFVATFEYFLFLFPSRT